ncbi:VOC family protein [Nonomuraea sp. ATR24]|uniref:VOC family protein n=1 Tax=Nonomuraea TaxID=83681 RepID=UPI001C5DE0A1|nr:VOC family protein [Nonomuraea ceibae]
MKGIAEYHSTVIDCPDPKKLADFYSRLFGWPVIYDEDDWVVLKDTGSSMRLAFQRVGDFRPPVWPEGERPQQLHIDTVVDDLDAAEEQVLKFGATKHEVQPSESDNFRVYLDPAGHPFCLTIAD